MALSKLLFVKFSTVGIGAFTFMFLLYPISLPVLESNSNKVLLSRQPPPIYSNPVFSNIEKRISQDKQNIEKLCSNYNLGPKPSVSVKIDYKPIQIQNYFMNKEKNLGWCINAKVINKQSCYL